MQSNAALPTKWSPVVPRLSRAIDRRRRDRKTVKLFYDLAIQGLRSLRARLGTGTFGKLCNLRIGFSNFFFYLEIHDELDPCD